MDGISEEDCVRTTSIMYSRIAVLTVTCNGLKTDPQYIELVDNVKEILNGNHTSTLLKNIQGNLSSLKRNYPQIEKDQKFKDIEAGFSFLWQYLPTIRKNKKNS